MDPRGKEINLTCTKEGRETYHAKIKSLVKIDPNQIEVVVEVPMLSKASTEMFNVYVKVCPEMIYQND